jgi:hypothetical protein
MTVYFQASADELEDAGQACWPRRADRASRADTSTTPARWSEGGELLATTHQVMYYKE